MTRNDLLLRAARGEETPYTPVWLMRQAGRSDPAYRALRQRVNLPLEDLFRHAELGAEISLLPRRIGVDAIILFQDILTPLAPLGAPFVFRPGPTHSPIRGVGDLRTIDAEELSAELHFVSEEIAMVRESLAGALPLLGFAGSPVTLAFFLLQGGSPGSDATRAGRFMTERPDEFERLLELLTRATIDYLALQVDAGIDAFQLFESVAPLLSRDEYERFAHPCHRRIFAAIRERSVSTCRAPGILFVREQPFADLMAESGADVLSVGRCVDLEEAKRRYSGVAFQGNVDNELLAKGDFCQIDEAVRRCVEAGGHTGHILNLNHGVLAETPFENVCRFVEACHKFQVESSAVHHGQ